MEQVSLLIQMAILDLQVEALPSARSLLRLEVELDLVEPQQVEQRGLLSWHQTQVVPQPQMAALAGLGCQSQHTLQPCVEVLAGVLEEVLVSQMQHFKAAQEDVLAF